MLSEIGKHRPQILILGVFERGDGRADLEFLTKIKSAYPELQIVFNTSLGFLEDDALASGAAYFNLKSPNVTSLLKVVNEIAEKLEKENN